MHCSPAGDSKQYQWTFLHSKSISTWTIIEAIINGKQPSDLTSVKLNHAGNLPIDWSQQNEMLGL